MRLVKDGKIPNSEEFYSCEMCGAVMALTQKEVFIHTIDYPTRGVLLIACLFCKKIAYLKKHLDGDGTFDEAD